MRKWRTNVRNPTFCRLKFLIIPCDIFKQKNLCTCDFSFTHFFTESLKEPKRKDNQFIDTCKELFARNYIKIFSVICQISWMRL